MRRRILLLLLFVAIILPTSFILSQYLKVGFLLGSPYAFWSGNTFKGIEYDIWKAVSQEIGYQLEVYVLPFSVIAPEILTKLSMDVVVGGIHMTEERKKLYDFGTPYMDSGLAIVTRSDIKWDGKPESITFGVKKGATGETIVQQWNQSGKKVKYVSYVSNEEIITNLLIKKIDGAFFDYINALYLAKMYGLTVQEQLIYTTKIGYISLNKELKSQIDKAIQKLLKENKIRQVLVSYVGNY
ncbi:MAG: substrate-binding periplasmic protein [Fervidobacterium sp.]|uniref:substrate-binding periplasmic protein n=1 Tax=Fervidobacterium sp. TaxID=1871331 RepID=UPI0040495812